MADLIKILAKNAQFNYTIHSLPYTPSMGWRDPQTGQWAGTIGEIVNGKADIGLATIWPLPETELHVDFTEPYYDLSGIAILMQKPPASISWFSFVRVFEPDVWACILAAYILTR